MDAGTGAAVQTLRGHAAPLSAVAFAPGGQRLATAAADGTLRLWDLGTGQSVLTLRTRVSLSAVAFGPDGRHLVAGDDEGSVFIWDAGRPLSTAKP
jgi:WD40 repeat protein